MLKKVQAKITKKTNELKQLIGQQEGSVDALRARIESETQLQKMNKKVYDKAMEDVQALQTQIRAAEEQFSSLQQEMHGKKRDASEAIATLQAELQALQQQTADKHKTYEESIQFFFLPSRSESPR